MKKEIRNGLIGGISLLFFYFLIMSITSRSWSATISQFKDLWYWMLILSGGFGLQVGLFTHLKEIVKNPHQMKDSKAVAATSTGTSAAGMIACCAHHLTDVLPIIGLSGLAVFLTQYQTPLIILGIAMNGFGIFYMLKQINKVKGKKSRELKFFSSITMVNKILLSIFIMVLIVVSYIVIGSGDTKNSSQLQKQSSNNQQYANKLSPQVNDTGNVIVEATPQVLEAGKNAVFDLVFETHSVDLSFDVTNVSSLIDDKGNMYKNTAWEGSPPGGHHRNGTLTFNETLKKTQYVELLIKNLSGVPERKFRFEL